MLELIILTLVETSVFHALKVFIVLITLLNQIFPVHLVFIAPRAHNLPPSIPALKDITMTALKGKVWKTVNLALQGCTVTAVD